MPGEIDDKMRDEMLNHPDVKKAMAKAGENALFHPEVQQAILTVAQEKYPEVIDEVPSKIAEWANDPGVQGQAFTAVATVARKTVAAIAEAPREVYALLQQGPAGVRVLAFFGGMISVGLSCWQLAGFSMIFNKPIFYIIDVYQMIFAIITVLFEAKPEWIACIKSVDRFHDLLCEYCYFLCTAFGRGLFYIFQASLWLGDVDPWGKLKEWFELGVGMYMAFIGLIHVAMHYGVMPQQIAEKSRQIAMRATAMATEVARKTIVSMENMRQSILETAHKDQAGAAASSSNQPGEVEMGPPTFANKATTGI